MNLERKTTENTQTRMDDNILEVRKINVMLNIVTNLNISETDNIKSLPVYVTRNGDIMLQSVLTQLKLLGYSLSEAKVWYYSKLYEDFVCCMNELTPKSLWIKDEDTIDGFLLIKIEISSTEMADKTVNNSISSLFLLPSLAEFEGKNDERGLYRIRNSNIESILIKVAEWRQLYIGYSIPDGRRIKCTLEGSAAVVGMQKKTLDDYFLQIKKAIKNNFDFDCNRNKPFGIVKQSVNKLSGKRRKPEADIY